MLVYFFFYITSKFKIIVKTYSLLQKSNKIYKATYMGRNCIFAKKMKHKLALEYFENEQQHTKK